MPSIDETPKGKTCDAILGILDEGKEIMDEYKGMPALDAGLLAAAQAVEHYEISRYGTLKTWANELGYKDAVKLLDATLKEEKATDAALTQLAVCRSQSARRDRRKPTQAFPKKKHTPITKTPAQKTRKRDQSAGLLSHTTILAHEARASRVDPVRARKDARYHQRRRPPARLDAPRPWLRRDGNFARAISFG